MCPYVGIHVCGDQGTSWVSFLRYMRQSWNSLGRLGWLASESCDVFALTLWAVGTQYVSYCHAVITALYQGDAFCLVFGVELRALCMVGGVPFAGSV